MRSTQKFILHPGYIKTNLFHQDRRVKASDIAIVFWSEPIRMREMEVQPICLPEKRAWNYEPEYAMMTGWGLTAPPNQIEYYPPIGWVKILPASYNESDAYGDLILAYITPYPGGTGFCKVSIRGMV